MHSKTFLFFVKKVFYFKFDEIPTSIFLTSSMWKIIPSGRTTVEKKGRTVWDF